MSDPISVLEWQSDCTKRVFSIERGGKRYWVKSGVKDYNNYFTQLIGSISDRVIRGDSTAHPRLMREMRAITALQKSGITVPQIIESNRHYLLLSDIGPCLQDILRSATPEEQERLVQQAAVALKKLHASGHWHGASQLKNMTLCNGAIGFIDFENTVHCWLSQLMRQSYDLWQLASSASRFNTSGGLSSLIFRSYGNARAVKLLLWVAHILFPLYMVLKPFERNLPRDIRQTIVTMRGLFKVRRHVKFYSGA